MSSKIVLKFPPNYAEIKDYLNPPSNSIYAYDKVIYNPSERHIFEDEEIHEQVHFKQQGKFSFSKTWWNKYLTDKDFRLHQELEAYATQYQFLKNVTLAKDLKEALREMAHALANDYGLDITYAEAESRIKKYNVL